MTIKLGVDRAQAASRDGARKRELLELSQYSQIRLWHLSLPSVPGIGEHVKRNLFGKRWPSFCARETHGRSRKSVSKLERGLEEGCRV